MTRPYPATFGTEIATTEPSVDEFSLPAAESLKGLRSEESDTKRGISVRIIPVMVINPVNDGLILL